MAKSKLEQMKEAINNTTNEGGNSSFLFFKSDGEKHVVRFTTDLEGAVGPIAIYEPKVFDASGKVKRFACPTNWGEKALSAKVIDQFKKPSKFYFFSVYDYDPEDKSKEKGEMKILPVKASSKSLLKSIVDFSQDEDDGGLLERDYVIKRSGTGTATTYSISSRSPRDMPKVVKDAAKVLTEEKIKEAVKAFFSPPSEKDWEESEDDDEDEKPKKKTKKETPRGKTGTVKTKNSSVKAGTAFDDDEDEDDEDTKAALKKTKELDSYDDDEDE